MTTLKNVKAIIVQSGSDHSKIWSNYIFSTSEEYIEENVPKLELRTGHDTIGILSDRLVSIIEEANEDGIDTVQVSRIDNTGKEVALHFLTGNIYNIDIVYGEGGDTITVDGLTSIQAIIFMVKDDSMPMPLFIEVVSVDEHLANILTAYEKLINPGAYVCQQVIPEIIDLASDERANDGFYTGCEVRKKDGERHFMYYHGKNLRSTNIVFKER